MKSLVLFIIALSVTTPIFSQSITIDENGIVTCKNVPIGTTETVNGDIYEVVDRDLLIQRRDDDADLTKVCVSNVTDMSQMFAGEWSNHNALNQPIGNWDVSNVTDMSGMFWGAGRMLVQKTSRLIASLTSFRAYRARIYQPHPVSPRPTCIY